jgi:D-proline reductase (dithiol) PrdB
MLPINYIPIMKEYYQRQGWGEYPIAVPEGHPWTGIHKPLAECRLAIICSAGLGLHSQEAFNPEGSDDLSIREIPVDTPTRDLVINYDYFDHSDADADINCIFPVERLKELREQGVIGNLAPVAYGIGVGRWKLAATPDRIGREMAADLAQKCQAQSADAVLLIPT